MNNPNSPLVSIRCITYNHEKYIRDALEGFVMQKTNFKFEAIVHDDASTDNTAAIIREYAEKYPDIIKPIFETENQYSKHDGSIGRIMNAACKGKYIAFCEGDDYWTDPYKLQKQVDFMESNPECTLSCHACKNIFEDFTSNIRFGESVHETYTPISLMENYFQTATILIRKEILFSDLYNKAIKTGCLSGDLMLYLTASKLGSIKGINTQMSVYRRHKSGLSSSMENAKMLYYNYKTWIKVGNLFGGEIKTWLEHKRLKSYIFNSFKQRKFPSFFKMIYYGVINKSPSVIYGINNIMQYYYHRIMQIICFPKRKNNNEN